MVIRFLNGIVPGFQWDAIAMASWVGGGIFRSPGTTRMDGGCSHAGLKNMGFGMMPGERAE